MTTPAAANEIRITRVYDAPVARVWDAWTDATQIAQWWGPRGFTLTTRTRDLRSGGSWTYTMHAPDGTDYPNFTRYHEVVPRERLVYDHGATSADAAPMFRVTVVFRDMDGTTELDIRMALPTAEDAERTRTTIKDAGGNATWDRLAEFLAKEQSSSEIFVITRTFVAPIETVFDHWTEPSKLAAWLPPAGFEMTFTHVDISTGGRASMMMRNGGFVMYVRHEYREVSRPDRLVYTQSFTDEFGAIARQPGAPTWPETTLVAVHFVQETVTETRVTVRFDVCAPATGAEVATFVGERAGMTQGWSASFDALDTRLAELSAGAPT